MKRSVMIKNICAFAFIVTLSACSKNLENLNENIKDATRADGATFFAYAEKLMGDALQDLTYGASGTPFTTCRLFAQQISCNTYNEGSNYFIQFDWDNIYMDVLKNLDESKKTIEVEETIDDAGALQKKNQLAMIEIMTVYTYARLVEAFGDIPYSEALNIDKVTAKYDDAQTVYTDLMARLHTAVNNLDAGGGSFGSADLIYGGSVTSWIKFGNSMKLQMGLRMIDVLPDLGTETVREAIDNVFSSNADNALLVYQESTPNTNPLWVDLAVGNRQDFVAAAPLVDEMNALNDPRRAVFFTSLNGSFIGAPYGQPVEYNQFSHMGNLFYTPTVPAVFIDYATVEFLLAEASERGVVGSPADAEEHYNNGIRASFDYYGVSDVDEYLAQPTVAYQSADGPWKKKIGMQKWIALYNQGYEAWTEYRRLDYPELQAPAAAFINIVPVRLLYPTSEQTLNGANWQAASTAIGGDLMTTKLFWDLY